MRLRLEMYDRVLKRKAEQARERSKGTPQLDKTGSNKPAADRVRCSMTLKHDGRNLLPFSQGKSSEDDDDGDDDRS